MSAQPKFAFAEGDGGFINTSLTAAGADSQATAEQTAALSNGKDLKGEATTTPMEYLVKLACQGADPGLPAGDTQACTKAVTACQGPAGAVGIGLLYEIYGRPVGSVDWAFVATTCFANQVPGGPVLNIGMIVQAFHTTPWATATVATQPEGNVTLVGLKTFYRVTWSEQGYQPGEIDPIDPGRMLGMRVDIRPKLVGLTYVFGDGATLGPTTSAGGTYPTGDITHTYVTAGTYPSRVDVTFGGEFRINGGPWTTIPDTVTITGPITTVQAKVAKAVLVQ